ncbi:hypothetical protein ACHAW5_004700 [Stephanodiscus triporus]|uniref:Uncharacterized protein n=1 Tax=Stephanodiscus triporus TaxID=2934178 RepID=A0ABD3MHN0_9STRA
MIDERTTMRIESSQEFRETTDHKVKAIRSMETDVAGVLPSGNLLFVCTARQNMGRTFRRGLPLSRPGNIAPAVGTKNRDIGEGGGCDEEHVPTIKSASGRGQRPSTTLLTMLNPVCAESSCFIMLTKS